MSINNLVWDLKFKIENIVTDYESKINLTEEEKKVLSHAYRLLNDFDELHKKIRMRIPKATQSDINQIKADINSLLDIAKSDKINNAKKIHLLEYGVETLADNYEKTIQEDRTLQDKIKAVKAKRDEVKREEQELLRDINKKIERIKESKALKKTVEQQEQKERTARITGAIERVKAKKEAPKTETINQTTNTQITKVSTNNKMIDDKQNKKNKSLLQRIKDKIISIKPGKSNVTKKEKRKSKLPWFVAVPLAGLFAFSIGSQVSSTSQNTKNDNDKKLVDENTSHNDNEKMQVTTATEKYDVEFENNTQTSTEQATIDNTSIDNENINSNNTIKESENSTPPKNEVDTPKDALEEKIPQEVVVNIGDKVVVDNGVSYSQTCFGEGNVGVIGEVSWRPSTEYCVEKVAFFHDGQFLGLTGENTESINSQIKKYAEECGVDVKDIETKVLISLVPGSYDTGWASLNIEQMQNNIVEHEINTNKNNSSRPELNNQER